MQPNEREIEQQKRMLSLLGKFDVDPGRYRPLYYGVPITVGVAEGAVGRGSVSLNNQPYIVTHVLHQIVGNTNDYSTTGLAQDGQYLITIRDEQSNYLNEPLPAEMLFGSVRSGYINPLVYPIPFAGNKTLTFEVTNLYTRTIGQETEFKVYVAVGGTADWGDLT
jgi:hypothetical protein